MNDLFDLDGFTSHGLELYRDGKKQEAIGYWRNILESHPHYERCQHYLDIALINSPTEQPQKRAKQLIAEITNERTFEELYHDAMSAYSQRHYSEAEHLFQRCLVLRDDIRVQHNLKRLKNR